MQNSTNNTIYVCIKHFLVYISIIKILVFRTFYSSVKLVVQKKFKYPITMF